ncbi:MAG: long-chain fatty acid transport protein, partial [Thermoanaerobaculia bacterium]|nr:long-chain fatty acid transport protein [Thermoanaerobaculia bacterium]
SVGTEFLYSDRLTLRAGIADEHTPVPDATREPRVPEADHMWYAVGATWGYSKRLAIDLFVVHLTTASAAINISSPAAGTLRGDARWNIWTVGGGGTLRF